MLKFHFLSFILIGLTAIIISIPLFHFGERSNKVRAAKAKLEQTRLQQQNLNEQMLLELASK